MPKNKKVIYSSHLEFRLKVRDILYDLPKEIFYASNEHYFDNETENWVAVKKTEYKSKLREMIVVYEEKYDYVVLVTIHPLKGQQKLHRIKSGRWQKI